MFMNFKKIFFILSILIMSIGANAQRWSYVDTEYILSKLPQYREAQSQLDKMSRDWQKEIEIEVRTLKKMKVSLENERALLTQDLVEDKEEQIADKIVEIETLQQKRFGAEGDLVSQRKQLVRPIQDQVFNAIQEVAKKRKYDAVFDKSGDLILLYYNKKYDISDRVLKKLNSM